MGVIVVMLVMVVMIMMNMSVAVVMVMATLGKEVADAVNSDVLRPATAYFAHDYLPFFVLEGTAASRCPA
jgi:hypothetical protein